MSIADDARAWLSDCEFHGLEPEQVEELDDLDALWLVRKHHDGGITGFRATNEEPKFWEQV